MKKTKINKLLLKLLIAIVTITGCLHDKNSKKTTPKIIHVNEKIQSTIEPNQNTNQKEKHVLTVWIHGTRLGSVQRLLFKDFFHRKIGLHPVSSYKNKHNIKKIALHICSQKTKRFKLEDFYSFGWSGDLSNKKRQEAALKLHQALLKLIAQYNKKYKIVPKIRLITHSHGGNVALCLSNINDNKTEKIKIYELILLACPIQKKTSHLVKNQMFEKIYSLYSGMDILQVIDPQGLTPSLRQSDKQTEKRKKKDKETPIFSQRRFKPQKNILQAKLKINKRGILHLEFLLKKFTTLMPYLLEELDDWKNQEKIKNQPYKNAKLIKIKIKDNNITFERKIIK